MRMRATLIVTAMVIASLLVPSAAQAGQGPALISSSSKPAPRACVATVSTARPVQYSTVTVTVRSVGAKASVTTIAKYKTKPTQHTATANSKGVGSTVYKISGATHGFKVVVSVAATLGAARWACSTSFTTR